MNEYTLAGDIMSRFDGFSLLGLYGMYGLSSSDGGFLFHFGYWCFFVFWYSITQSTFLWSEFEKVSLSFGRKICNKMLIISWIGSLFVKM